MSSLLPPWDPAIGDMFLLPSLTIFLCPLCSNHIGLPSIPWMFLAHDCLHAFPFDWSILCPIFEKHVSYCLGVGYLFRILPWFPPSPGWSASHIPLLPFLWRALTHLWFCSLSIFPPLTLEWHVLVIIFFVPNYLHNLAGYISRGRCSVNNWLHE